MAALGYLRIVTLCGAAALTGIYLASPAAACEPGKCENGATQSKPLNLKKHQRRPVASSATRTIKRSDGEYRKVAFKRRAKPAPEAQPVLPPLSPAAAQAFASYELARVRVVSPELIEETRLLADLVANSSTIAEGTTIVGADSVQVVQSDEVNDIDLKADTPYAISLDALSRDLAGSRSLASTQEPRDDSESWLETWLQRALLAFGSAFAGLTTLVRILLG